jgi:CDP-diacylglycerol pyrophosphatase
VVQNIFWDGWDSRKYFSDTIDNEWFKIYSGIDGSLGNILQTQLTMSVQNIFWDGWVSRKYSSNTIDNERFNIYSGMNGSVGNIFQT